MSGQSGTVENVFENIINNKNFLCVVRGDQKQLVQMMAYIQNSGYEKEYLACQKAMQVSRDSPICRKI